MANWRDYFEYVADCRRYWWDERPKHPGSFEEWFERRATRE